MLRQGSLTLQRAVDQAHATRYRFKELLPE
jgi:hypothetical protein